MMASLYINMYIKNGEMLKSFFLNMYIFFVMEILSLN